MNFVCKLNINDHPHDIYVPANKTLLEVLREDLGLTGTKHGCELGECGVCTVLIDGQAMLSCLVLPADVQGKAINTIEALAENGRLHPLQEAFTKYGATQCGFCIPGVLLTAKALVDKVSAAAGPKINRQQIREAMAGNLCRCTGYTKIIQAIEQVVLDAANE